MLLCVACWEPTGGQWLDRCLPRSYFLSGSFVKKATCLFPSEFVTTLQWCFQCGPKLNLKWRLKKAASAVNDSDKEPRTGFVQGPWFGT